MFKSKKIIYTIILYNNNNNYVNNLKSSSVSKYILNKYIQM